MDIRRFPEVRRFVFQYFEAEHGFEVTDELNGIFEVFLPYLHYEESYGDPDCNLRIRRLYDLLSATEVISKESIVFAIEFEKLRDLTKKAKDEQFLILFIKTRYRKLSPCNFDYDLVKLWATNHLDEKEPVLAKMKDFRSK